MNGEYGSQKAATICQELLNQSANLKGSSREMATMKGQGRQRSNPGLGGRYLDSQHMRGIITVYMLRRLLQRRTEHAWVSVM
jgi:hypothetical protein